MDGLNEEEQQALDELIEDGEPILETEEVDERLAVCIECEFCVYEDITASCDICGCMIKVRARQLNEGCPMSKWSGDNFRD